MMATQNQLAEQRAEFTYSFPAVAGVQAGKQYFTAQVPYGALVRLFTFDDEEQVPAELRAQRQLNEPRAKKIGQYVCDNRLDYVLPAITASCDSAMHFEPIVGIGGAADRLGLLNIPMDATLLINDGQHRRRGIEHAIAQDRLLKDETIAVTIFYDQGLKRSQQIFADINSNQVKPSGAINMVYDHRNAFSAWVMALLERLPRLKARIELEASSVGKKSLKLWSIVAVKKAIMELTGLTERNFQDTDPAKREQLATLVIDYFAALDQHLPSWKAMLDFEVPASEVRENLLIGHAVFLEALSLTANLLLTERGNLSDLAKLRGVPVAKQHPCWQGRCVVMGRMNKTASGVKATAAELCRQMGLTLPPELRALDDQVLSAA